MYKNKQITQKNYIIIQLNTVQNQSCTGHSTLATNSIIFLLYKDIFWWYILAQIKCHDSIVLDFILFRFSIVVINNVNYDISKTVAIVVNSRCYIHNCIHTTCYCASHCDTVLTRGMDFVQTHCVYNM